MKINKIVNPLLMMQEYQEKIVSFQKIHKKTFQKKKKNQVEVKRKKIISHKKIKAMKTKNRLLR